MEIVTGLVYDVGLFDGSDTAYHLAKGRRVVAVDANPTMITAARVRFAEEIASGRLVLVHAAIAAAAGIVEFFISQDDPGASSSQRAHVAQRDGKATQALVPIEVEAVTLPSLFRAYGLPWLLKIDIEGLDRVGLDALDASHKPSYVSWEVGSDALDSLRLMHEKGYRSFKAIHQTSFFDLATRESVGFRIRRRLARALNSPTPSYRDPDGWEHRTGHSAGPAEEATSGKWRDCATLTAEWARYVARHPKPQDRDGWYDFHARLGP